MPGRAPGRSMKPHRCLYLAGAARAPEAAATPILDEALARAEARNVDLIEALARDDAPKPTPMLALAPPPNPLAVEPPKPAPAPTPLPVEPQPAERPEPAPKTPEETWREGIRALRAVARDHPKTATPGGPNWAVRDRLLAWLAEPDIDSDARGAGDLARGRAVFRGLSALIDPTTTPDSRGAEIREAVVALETAAPLEIADLTPCRTVHGFGNVEPLEPPSRKPGQVHPSCYRRAGRPGLRARRPGLPLARRGDGRAAPRGLDHPLVVAPAGDGRGYLPQARRRDCHYIGHKLTLPDGLAPGSYRLRLTQKDLVAEAMPSATAWRATISDHDSELRSRDRHRRLNHDATPHRARFRPSSCSRRTHPGR